MALLLDRLTDVLVKSLEVKWKSRWKFNTKYTSAGELQHECEHYHYDGKTCFFFATTEFIDCIHRQLCKVSETG